MIRLRRGTIAVSAVAFLAVLIVPAFVLERASLKDLDSIKSRRAELKALGSEYRTLKDQVGSVEQKTTISKVSGIANVMEDIASSVGLKGKLKSIKGVGTREIQGSLTEESAEVQMEKVTLNELVNMFYRIGEAPVILSVKRTTIKKSFENPELLNVTMTLALFTKK